ncbi:MAG: hypothetical protein BroJett018_51440 [Chloroflexota bacterium]|nr:MAG: hypothetical protein BroJett018_51440 [Chloroflexota bacterium]
MKSGKCPKCGSTEVYTKRSGMQSGYTVGMGFANTKHMEADDYICMVCGYFEQYLVEVASKLKDLPSKWKKAGQ